MNQPINRAQSPTATGTEWGELFSSRELATIHSLAHVGLQRLADTILQPWILISVLVWLQNGSVADIAVVATIATASNALGSMVMPYIVDLLRNVRMVLLVASMIRGIAAVLISILGWQITEFASTDFVSLLVISLILHEFGSAANIATNPRSTIAAWIEPTSLRARQNVGIGCALIGGLTAWSALSNERLPYPDGFGWLLMLAGIASLGSIWFQLTQPVRQNEFSLFPPVATWSMVRGVLANGAVRGYLWLRLLFGASTFIDPFLMLYGLTSMQLDFGFIGAVLLVLVLAQMLGSGFWSLFPELTGTRRAIQVAVLVRLIGISAAIAIPSISQSAWAVDHFASWKGTEWAWVIVFFFIGLSQNAWLRNEIRYPGRLLVDTAWYPAVNFLTSATQIVTSIMILIGAWIVQAGSFRMAMVVSALFAALAFVCSALLRAKHRPSPRTYLKREYHGPRSSLRQRKRRYGSRLR